MPARNYLSALPAGLFLPPGTYRGLGREKGEGEGTWPEDRLSKGGKVKGEGWTEQGKEADKGRQEKDSKITPNPRTYFTFL